MTNAEIIKGFNDEQLAEFLFKWQVVTTCKGLQLEMNELLNAANMRRFLQSEDHDVLEKIMSTEWAETDIDFTRYMEVDKA